MGTKFKRYAVCEPGTTNLTKPNVEEHEKGPFIRYRDAQYLEEDNEQLRENWEKHKVIYDQVLAHNTKLVEKNEQLKAERDELLEWQKKDAEVVSEEVAQLRQQRDALRGKIKTMAVAFFHSGRFDDLTGKEFRALLESGGIAKEGLPPLSRKIDPGDGK